MKGCRPLDQDELSRLKTAFTGRMAVRNKALFFLGVNTGFRISELLSLRLRDVLTPQGAFPRYLSVRRENMKGRVESRSVILNDQAKAALRPWLQALAERDVIHQDDFVFRSMVDHNKAICREQAWKVFVAAYRALGLEGRIGTHGMRKRFANHLYDYFLELVAAGQPVDALRQTSRGLGHKNIGTTDVYLSFKNGQVDGAVGAVGVMP